MITPISTGGPAFPVSTGDGETGHQDSAGTWQFPGMSLRDHFAGLAMQGDIQSMPLHEDPALVADVIARRAYIVADAMLHARLA